MSGGLLGVGVFFTLSGFLITGILLSSWRKTGSLNLKQFWLRRARRLLPAVVVAIAVVLLATALVDRSSLSTRWGESLASLFYVSNWYTIQHGVSYFDRFAGPGALGPPVVAGDRGAVLPPAHGYRRDLERIARTGTHHVNRPQAH
jgi:peptidoglycan/LPS O-acetylase OafA/YrhL